MHFHIVIRAYKFQINLKISPQEFDIDKTKQIDYHDIVINLYSLTFVENNGISSKHKLSTGTQ